MNRIWLLPVLPVISAVIGWLTNWVAIKMLFHPRERVNILGFHIQGLFPKRQRDLARRLGETVETELFSHEDVNTLIKNPELEQRFIKLADKHVDEFLDQKLKVAIPVVGMFLDASLRRTIHTAIMNQLTQLIPEILQDAASYFETHLDVRNAVEQKVSALDPFRLEDLLVGLMKKEFRYIELIGGVLGFVIGLMQIAIVLFIQN